MRVCFLTRKGNKTKKKVMLDRSYSWDLMDFAGFIVIPECQIGNSPAFYFSTFPLSSSPSRKVSSLLRFCLKTSEGICFPTMETGGRSAKGSAGLTQLPLLKTTSSFSDVDIGYGFQQTFHILPVWCRFSWFCCSTMTIGSHRRSIFLRCINMHEVDFMFIVYI